ncbi:alpha/beta hydrolase, partial [Pseudomonas syringae]|nr:alpha/beta hydrolase [Pseudomonas syringae]
MIKPLLVLLLSTAFVSLGAHAEDQAVNSISPDRLAINGAEATLGLSQEWVHPKPKIERVVIVLHGRLRNAQTYLRSIERAANQSRERGKTLLIAPQFLDEKDIVAHHLPDSILRWRQNSWMEGATSTDPKPVSSFLVLDHILKRLSDSKLFPNLKEIVIAGHSGGAQVVQRYAMIGGKEDALLQREGVKLRYVIANPSSYA